MIFAIRRPLSIPSSWPPTLLVVIDTEEEFDWNAPFHPNSTQVQNIREQPLAQAILDTHAIRPTYIIDYPIAVSPEAQSTLGEIATSNRCTIGAHLHPWVTPPHEGAIDTWHSYAGNLPPALEQAKLVTLTNAVEAGFGVRPTVFKAGRYGVGPDTMRFLQALGYRVDCSVVPFTDFSADGGPDFSAIEDRPFTVPGGTVELPLSVNFAGMLAGIGPRLLPLIRSRLGRRLHFGGVLARTGLLEQLRLSPEGHTLADMVRQTRAALAQGTRLFMLTYHSSSLLPGAAPYVRDEAGRQAFLGTLEKYCEHFMGPLGGRPGTMLEMAATLAE